MMSERDLYARLYASAPSPGPATSRQTCVSVSSGRDEHVFRTFCRQLEEKKPPQERLRARQLQCQENNHGTIFTGTVVERIASS